MNDNKTIAVNTVILTIKLVISIVCSFVVSRLILQALGADNYGLYNVVGGIVAMLNLVATSMIATSYRYMAVEIGKGELGNPQKVYSTLILIHFILALCLVVIGFPLGAYYIEHFLNVTNASLADAHYVYIFSLVATFFSIIVVPSNGLLVAMEKFMPLSIIEICKSLLNVTIAVVLLTFAGNRLRLYALLMAILIIGYNIAFYIWCRVKYPSITNYKFNNNIKDYKEITIFTGWMLLGASAVVGRTQGVAMVINLFFRNSINAAFGIATQIGNAANMFTTTLRQAVTPQIMKNQEGNASRSLNLVYAISRYTYLIMLVLCAPLLLCMDTILEIWLGEGNIPPYANVFAIFLLISGMISNLNSGFDASIQASGEVKKNQIGYTIINLSIIPIVYILYKIGLPAYINVIFGLCITVVTLLFQSSIMKEQTEFTYWEYWKKTVCPSLVATIVAFVPMILLRVVFGNEVKIVLLFICLSVIWTSLVIFFVGVSRNEREMLLNYIKSKVSKR